MSVVNQENLDKILEHALHALVSARCIRAYKHEVRNGLQGVYGGVDALIRHARAQSPTFLSLDRTVEFVREAVRKHESSIDSIVEHLAPGENTPDALGVSALVSEFARFLSNDAARHAVRLKEVLEDGVTVRARPQRVRLALLGLITDSIDAMPAGGDLTISTRVQTSRGEIEIADTRGLAASPVADPWALDLACEPMRKGILMHVTRAIVRADGGDIDCEYRDTGGRVVRIRWPRA
jgi:signal transduction histidine kinase